MKKFLVPLISFILLIGIIAVIAWFNLPTILSNMLAKEFTVAVSVGNVDFSKNKLKVNDLNIGTPRNSQTKSSFYAKEIHLSSTLNAIRATRLTIESLTFNNSIISVEYYNDSGSDNNWVRILKTATRSKKPTDREYLIKKMTLNNVTVVLTKKNGQRQTFPTIEKLEFKNISNESGFPIDEIEKAITQAILKSVFEKFNLLNLIQEVEPTKIIQKVVPFFNSK